MHHFLQGSPLGRPSLSLSSSSSFSSPLLLLTLLLTLLLAPPPAAAACFPGSIGFMTCSDETSSSITVNLENLSDGENGNCGFYYVEAWNFPSPPMVSAWSTPGPISFTFIGLTAATSYSFEARYHADADPGTCMLPSRRRRETAGRVRSAVENAMVVAGVKRKNYEDASLSYGVPRRGSRLRTEPCPGPLQSVGGCSTLPAATPPSQGPSPTCIDTGANHIEVQWSPPDNGGSPITDYVVRATPGPEESVGLALQHAFSGLAQGTLHQFQFRAVNSVGPGPWSNIRNCYTDDVPSPMTPSCGAPAADSMDISWGTIATNGSPLLHIEYQVDSGGYINIGIPPGSEYNVGGLDPGTGYNFDFSAVNDMGPGPPGSVFCVTDSTAPNQPAAPTCSGETTSSYTTNWVAPDMNGSPLTRYHIMVNSVVDTDAGMSSPFVVTALDPGSAFTTRIRAANGIGPGPWSPSVICTTAPDVPDAPVMPTLVDTTNVVCDLLASAPNNNGDAINGYNWERNGADIGVGPIFLSNAGRTPGTAYSYRVRAINGVGPSAWSPARPCTTHDVPATSPPTCGTITTTSIVINIGTVNPNGATVTSHRYDYGTGDVVIGGSTSDTVTGLTPGDAYTFVASAANTYGYGPDSGGTVCTTNSAEPPAPPTPSCGTTTLSSIEINFAAVSDDHGSPIARYEIDQSSVGIETPINLPSPYLFSGLPPNSPYTFKVRAVNGIGPSQWSGTVVCSTTTAGPATPAPPTCVDETDSAVDLSWVAPNDNGSPIASYAVSRDGSDDAVGLTTTHTVTGLPAQGTSYVFRVRAINGVGTSQWSSGTSCTTDDVPTAAPPSCDGTTTTSADYSWAAATANGDPVSGYEFRINGGTPVANGMSLSHTATGLTPGDPYQIEVRATNGVGQGLWSGTATCTTISDVPPKPAAPSCGVPTANSLPFSWTAPADDHGSAIADYDVELDQGGLFTLVGLTHTYNGLAAATPYNVRVRANNGVGPSPWSDETSCSTDAGGPSVVATPTCDSMTANSVKFDWLAPNDNGQPITTYEVDIDTLSTTDVGDVLTYTWSTGLSPATSYGFRVRAINSVAPSIWSLQAVCTTSDTEPSVPNAPVCSATTSTSVDVTWTEPNTNGQPIDLYEVDINTSGPISSGTTETHSFTALLPATAFTIIVRARNSVGTSAYSAPVVCATDNDVPATPAPPTCGTLLATSIAVHWLEPVNNGRPILNYELNAVGVSSGSVGNVLTETTTGLVPDTDYDFRVSADNLEGSSEWSNTVTCRTADSVPDAPAMPVCVSTTYDSVTISWTSPTDNGQPVINFEISLDSFSIGNTASLTFTAPGLTTGVAYDFEVQAENGIGLGPASPAQSCTPAAEVPEAPVTPSCAADTYQSVSISWIAPNERGSALSGYEYRKDGGAAIPVGLVLDHIVTGLSVATSNDYEVRAVNGVGQSAWSSIVSCAPQPEVPTAPATPVCAQDTYTTLDISWVPSNARGSPITNYELTQDLAMIFTGPGTSHTATGLTTNQNYGFTVRAENDVGFGPVSLVLNCAPAAQVPEPVAPTCGTANSGAQPLSWIAPNDRGAAITEYDIYVDSTLEYSVSTFSFTMTGLTYYTQYDYHVIAKNSVGSSVPAAVVQCTTSADVPDIPVSLACATFNEFQIHVDWTEPAVQNGPAVTSYVLETTVPSATGVYSGGALDYAHSGLVPATEYRYILRAVNDQGTSAFTSEVSCTTSTAQIGSIAFVDQPIGNVLYNDELSQLPSVEILDSGGARVIVGPNSEETVVLTLSGGPGSIVGTDSEEAFAGLATGFTGLSGSAGGTTFELTATVLVSYTAVSLQFTLFERATSLSFVAEPQFSDLSASAFTTQPVVQLLDVNFELVATGPHASLDVTVSASTFGLTGTLLQTAVAGTASFTDLVGTLTDSSTSHTIEATVAAPSLLMTSAPFTIFPLATEIVFTTDPVGDVLEGVVLPTQPVVELRDAFGSTVTIGTESMLSIRLGPIGGGGVLGGVFNCPATAGVAACFSGLTLSVVQLGLVLRATVPSKVSIPAVDSVAFNIFGRADSVVFDTQPGGDVLTDADLATSPVLSIRDQLGAVITVGPHSTLDITLSLDTGPVGGTMNGVATRTAIAGVAPPFDGLQFTRTGSYELEAAIASPSVEEGAVAFVIFPRADSLVLVTQPFGNVFSSAELGTLPVVEIRDSFGDACAIGPHSALAVTLAPDSGSATGTATVNAVSGIATYSGVGVDRGGEFVIRASTASPLLFVDSVAIYIHGYADELSFCTQPIGNVLPYEVISQAPTVCTFDTNGQIVEYGPQSSLSIDLAIFGGDPRAELEGTATVVSSSGLATFPGLSITWNGTYSITASTALATAVTSMAVVIDIPSNLPPTLTVPSGPYTTPEDFERTVFVNASDPDANRGYDTFHVVMSLNFTDGPSAPVAAAQPCVEIGGSGSGLAFAAGAAGTCSPDFEFNGKVADINVALNGFKLVTGLDWHGTVSVGIFLDDMGNTGVGGILSYYLVLPFSVIAANDAPVIDAGDQISWSSTVANLVEDVPVVLPPLRVHDVDSPSDASQLELSIVCPDGKLKFSFEFQGAVQPFSSTHTLTSGTVADVVSALASVTVVSAKDAVGSSSYTLQVDDVGNSGSGIPRTDQFTHAATIAAVNDAPVWAVDGFGPGNGTAWNDTLRFDEHLTLDVSTSMFDVDASETTNLLEVTIWTDGDMGVHLSPPGAFGTVGIDGSDAPIVVTTTAPALYAAVSTLTLFGLDGYNGPETLHLVVSDLGATGLGGPKNATLHVPVDIAPIPTITSSLITSGAWGSRITIEGNDFGQTEDAVFDITVDGVACTNPTRITDKIVACNAPPGEGEGHVLDMFVDGIRASNPNLPIIRYAAPIEVQIELGTITRIVNFPNRTIEAYMFVNTTEPVAGVHVSVSNPKLFVLQPFVTLSQDPLGVSTEYYGRLRFRSSVTEFGSALVSFQVEFAGTWELLTVPVTRTFNVIEYPMPRIDSFSPSSVNRCGGVVTLNGDYFGPLATNFSDVTFGGLPCTTTTFVSPQRVLCDTDGSFETGALAVSTDSGIGVSATNLTVVERPVVNFVLPSSMHSLVSTPIAIRGDLLGLSAADVEKVEFVPLPSPSTPDAVPIACLDLEPHNDTLIHCRTPVSPWEAMVADVIVTTHSGCNSNPALARRVRFAGPVLHSVTPNSLSLFDTAVVTLQGTGFNGGPTQVMLGHRNCTSVNVLGSSMVTCTMNALPMDMLSADVEANEGYGLPTVLTTEFGGSTRERVNFSFPIPTLHISGVYPAQTYADRRRTVSIEGAGFGRRPEDVYSVTLAGYNCTAQTDGDVVIPIWENANTLACLTPLVDVEEEDVIGPIVVTTAYGVLEFEEYSFLFRKPRPASNGYEPTVSSVKPKSGVLSEEHRLVINGFFLAERGLDGHIVTVDGVPCRMENVTETEVICMLERGTAAGTFAVLMTTPFGEDGISTAVFQFLPPPPVVADCFPRVGRQAGGDNVTVVGDFFGQTPGGLSAMTMHGLDCASFVRISATEAVCVTRSFEEVGVLSGIEFTVTADGQTSAPVDCGFQYVDDSLICLPTCSRRADCVQSECVCRPGWTGRDCSTRNVVLWSDAIVPTATEDPSFDAVNIYVLLRERPDNAVHVTLSDVTRGGPQVEIAKEKLVFTPSSFSETQTFSVTGLDDHIRDGTRVASVSLTVESDDPQFDTSADLKSISVRVVDRAPRIYSIEPNLLPRIGENVTVIASDLDPDVFFYLGGDPVSVTSRKELPGKPEKKMTDVGTPVWNNELLGGRARQIEPPTEPIFYEYVLSFGERADGYHTLRVENLGGTMSDVSNVVFYTESCRKVGYFGPKCTPCPEGGICPGGDRVWAQPGYWVEDENSGIVGQCEYEFRCPGGQEATCASNYVGPFCAQCAPGHYAVSAGLCKPCPVQTGIMMYIAADLILWSALGFAAVLVRDRELFTYCVIAVRAIQTLAGIGETSTEDTPTIIRDIYDVLKLFSGDYSIVKADCINPVPFYIDFFFALGHSVAICLPMFFFLAVAKLLAKRRLKNVAEIERREEMNFYDDRRVRCLFVALTLVYLTVGTRSMQALFCEPIGEKLHLVASQDTVCFEGTHIYVAAVACILVISFVFGLPLGLLYWFRRNGRALYFNDRFMERYNFFYMQLQEGKHNLFLIEFYIFLTLMCAKAFLPGDPMYQNALVSSGFGLKLIIVISIKPFILGSDNTLQVLVSFFALVATNYNYLMSLGIFDTLRSVHDVLAYLLMALIAGIVLALIVIIIVQASQEAKLLAERRDGMAYDLGDDWKIGEGEEQDFAYSFDTSTTRARPSRDFVGLLGEAAAVRPFAEIEHEMSKTLAQTKREQEMLAEQDTLFGMVRASVSALIPWDEDEDGGVFGENDQDQDDGELSFHVKQAASSDYWGRPDMEQAEAWKAQQRQRREAREKMSTERIHAAGEATMDQDNEERGYLGSAADFVSSFIAQNVPSEEAEAEAEAEPEAEADGEWEWAEEDDDEADKDEGSSPHPQRLSEPELVAAEPEADADVEDVL